MSCIIYKFYIESVLFYNVFTYILFIYFIHFFTILRMYVLLRTDPLRYLEAITISHDSRICRAIQSRLIRGKTFDIWQALLDILKK